MICKDCIHEEVCAEVDDAITYCIDFKDKAQFVEVVRCKDCRYGEIDDPDMPNQYLCHHDGRSWNDENHFCSYGKKVE